MKNIVEFFKNKKLLFSELRSINLKDFGIKKRYKIYEGVDIKNRYVLIIIIDRKSRFLSRDAESILGTVEIIKEKKDHGYKLIYTLISSPICSKAKKILEDRGYKVINDSL